MLRTFLLLLKSDNGSFGGNTRLVKRGVLPQAVGALIISGLLAGCALTGKAIHKPIAPGLPLQVQLPAVPFFPQKVYQCGPAALAMALDASGVVVSADQLVSRVYAPERKGSLQTGLISAARRYERLAYPIKGLNCLFRQLASGRPVIVLQNLGLSWLPRWHYAVAVGYDLPAGHIILHTGLSEARRVNLSVFMNTWRRADQWGLVVMRANRIPECAEEPVYLNAALGLQQAGRLSAALEAFGAAARHWPESYAAHMALGNAMYASGDPQGAVQSFTRAIGIQPHNPMGYNNLAHVLAELGFLHQAREAAQKAVDLGGPQESLYRRTFDEIMQKMVNTPSF